MSLHRCALVSTVAPLLLVSIASAATLFSEPGESVSNYKIFPAQFPPGTTTARSVWYGAFAISESPRQIAGSAAQEGIALTTGGAGINLILGSTPITASGDHTLSFDVYMVGTNRTAAATDGLLGGIVRSTATDVISLRGRNGGLTAEGGWFSLSNNNAYELNANDNTVFAEFWSHDDAIRADKQAEIADAAIFNTTFANKIFGSNSPADDAANEWVRVDIERVGTTTTISLNDVVWSSLTTTNTAGFAWFGYEDLFSGTNTSPYQAFIDNVTLTDSTPEPSADFDNDGDIDGRDFLKWQRGGSPSPRSAIDLARWHDQYDASPIAAAVAVPEPAIISMIGLFASVFIFRNRRYGPL